MLDHPGSRLSAGAQPHRAEIAKLLVHRSARRRGIAQLLMERAEAEARAEGKTLLV
nr:GNAT family N-acetyltransferase [Actinomycetota bacterium]